MHSNDLFSHPDRPEVTADTRNDDITTITFSDHPDTKRGCRSAGGA
ncbi:hypothetical protein BN977_04142 [Mycolicibacterium cosmeticum]|uniref:Uncharacterized protein n=1 Tax=Mycolicibacterium cosmeticum TaxID=258533 RepID=W9B3E7_MYCCO|nr:hypothetical protein BN977_04142 [Mycolicibacterium cosmeticum]